MLKFSVSKIILVSLVSSALGAMWFAYNAYVPIYLQGGNPTFGDSTLAGFGLSPSATGFIMALDNIMVLFVAPFVGIWSDGLKSKLGRRLPFVVFAAPPMILGLFGAAFIPNLIPDALSGNSGALMYLFVPFVLSLMMILLANAFMATPASAMVYDWTPSEKRTTTNAILQVVALVTTVVVLISSSILYEIFPPLPFVLIAALLLISVTWVYFNMKGTPEPDTVEEESQSFRQVLNSLRQMPVERGKSLGFLATSEIMSMIGFVVLETFLTSYAVSKLSMDVGAAGSLMIIFLLMNLLMAFPAVKLNDWLGRRRTRILGFAVNAIACGLMALFPSETMLYVTLTSFAAGMSIVGIGTMPMWVDHLPSDKLMATIMSTYFFIVTLSSVIGPNISGWIVEAGGNNYTLIWPIASVFMMVAVLLTLLVKFGELHKENVSA